MRQIVLDTETTGIDPKDGHRIVEIGAVELMNRQTTGRTFHQYINPQRQMDDEVIRIHGITNEFVLDKPTFDQIIDDFMSFIEGTELLIHNASFDLSHLNAELNRLPKNPWGKIEQHARVTDTLMMARKKYPGQRNSLDALCRRLGVDNSKRLFHGALLDSEILADVYLMMTSGQTGLALDDTDSIHTQTVSRKLSPDLLVKLPLFSPSEAQLSAHTQLLEKMHKKGGCLWKAS